MGGKRATTGGERAVRATRRNPPRHINYTGGKTSRRISEVNSPPSDNGAGSDRDKGEAGPEEEGKESKTRKNRCGICNQCTRSDCGVCKHCKDMTKFGGTGRSKQACVERKCPNMAVKGQEEDSSSETEDTSAPEKSPTKTPVKHKAAKGPVVSPPFHGLSTPVKRGVREEDPGVALVGPRLDCPAFPQDCYEGHIHEDGVNITAPLRLLLSPVGEP